MINYTINNINLLGFIDESQYNIILLFFCVIWTVFSLLGIISNVINIKIFIAMRLNDSVTVSFLALSVFDLTYVVTTLCFAISSAFSLVEKTYKTRFLIDPYAVYIYFGNIAVLVNVMNTLITTFLAVARCMCVAKPLYFRHSFTVKKTTASLSGFAVFAVVAYTPIFASMGMVVRIDRETNITRHTLWISPRRESIKNVIWTLTQMVLPASTEFIVLFCIVIMANSLRAASKFRQTSQLPGCDKEVSHLKEKADSSNDTMNKLSGKDIRVVKQVTLISLVYIMCVTPKILISTAGLIEPEFTLGRRYGFLYLSLLFLRLHFEIFNASINTFVYYAYNTKFKTMLSWKN